MAGPPGVDASADADGSRGKERNIEDRLEGLKLTGEEAEDLDFSGEFDDLVKDVRWLALIRVHTSKSFSHSALFNAMRNAWTVAKEVNFKIKGDNLFLSQFHCLGDWTRVMDGGPWIFRGAPVVLEEYDGFSNIHEYKLMKIPAWVRIYGLPDGLMKKKELAEKVARKVGEPPFTVIVTEGMINPMPYLRARVHLDLAKALVRFVPITIKEAKRYPIQYEKLLVFCDFCGMMGHEVTECGDGVHKPEECEWGRLVDGQISYGDSRSGTYRSWRTHRRNEWAGKRQGR